jgi:hypothetical protein
MNQINKNLECQDCILILLAYNFLTYLSVIKVKSAALIHNFLQNFKRREHYHRYKILVLYMSYGRDSQCDDGTYTIDCKSALFRGRGGGVIHKNQRKVQFIQHPQNCNGRMVPHNKTFRLRSRERESRAMGKKSVGINEANSIAIDAYVHSE